MITEEQIEQEAIKYSMQTNGEGDIDNDDVHARTRVDFERGAKWVLNQTQWVSVEEMASEQKRYFNKYNADLIMCKFDNGDVLRYSEAHPFAVLTHVLYLPQPPQKGGGDE